MKASIIIPVYYNEENLRPLYEDIRKKFIERIDYEYEIVMVNDGSCDKSYEVMSELADIDHNIRIISLSRNFGAHAAVLCGLSHCTGDCAMIKAADLQEPTELLIEMVNKWREGYNVVLAVREEREESKSKVFWANMYYKVVQKMAFPQMPDGGFDCYLIDRKVINVLESLDERNSAVTGQILWSGFRTAEVRYTRLERQIGRSRWTLKKKLRLVMDTIFSFSTLPISIVLTLGVLSMIVAGVWAIVVLVDKLGGGIPVQGWTTLFIFNLFSFGLTMFTLGILGEYLWRTFDASRRRPPYIIEDDNLPSESGERDE